MFSSHNDDGWFALHVIDAGGGEARSLADDSRSIYATGWIGRLDPAFETGLESNLFPDGALVEAVRLAVGPAPSEPLSEDDLPGVLEMRALSPVSDLQGIGRLASLSVLVLSLDSLVDLSPLADLSLLQSLLLIGGRFDDLEPLAGLSNLEILRIFGGEATDLSPLRPAGALPQPAQPGPPAAHLPGGPEQIRDNRHRGDEGDEGDCRGRGGGSNVIAAS